MFKVLNLNNHAYYPRTSHNYWRYASSHTQLFGKANQTGPKI